MSKANEALRRTESRIPAFEIIEEEAEFWDTHDTVTLHGVQTFLHHLCL